MIRNREREARLGHLGTAFPQPAEGMKGAFVNVVTINPEQGLAVLATHNLVHRPHLVEQSLRFPHAVHRC